MEPWASFETPLESQIDDTVLNFAHRTLHLSEAQKHHLAQLHEAHRKRFREFRAKWAGVKKEFDQKERRHRVPTKAHHDVMLEREITLSEAADKQAELDERFISEIKPMLSESQLLHWPTFQYQLDRYRWRFLPHAFLPEQLDLVAIVEEIELDQDDGPEAPAELEEVLSGYMQTIHQRMQKVADRQEEVSRNHMRRLADRYKTDGEKVWIGRGGPGWERRFWRERKQTMAEHLAVSETNERYMGLIASVLPKDLRDDFQSACRHEMFRNVLPMKELTARAFVEEDVLDLSDLTDEQREAVHALYNMYEFALPSAYQAILDAQEELVETRYEKISRAEQENRQEAFDKALRKRLEVERRLVRDVWAILTPAQQNQLTKPEIPQEP